jgi:cysteinyl-tRNA synthetase
MKFVMLKLFNTLTGKKENFEPLSDREVKMYNCGPTVYNYAHIGNLRAYVFADILRRVLEYNGYKVTQVMNITDVGHLSSDNDEGDDKMVKALKRENKPFTLSAMREIADFYAKTFVDDLKSLNCELPHKMPHASDHIPEDIEIIKILEEKGFAYKASDGMYFDTEKFPDYGKLGKINLSGQKAGARVVVNSEKKNPADFTLWKISRHDIGWESPWGKGFPGWHIECSAMSRKYLGQPFDIHTGGIDHIPIHHNNEIAQSESAYDEPLANFWLHNAHLTMAGEKMAKSAGNFLTLGKLADLGIPPLAYRYFLLSAGYGTPISFQESDVKKTAVTSLNNLRRMLSELPLGGSVNENYKKEFLEAVNDDLNTALGLSVVYKVLDDKNLAAADKLATISDFDKVLGLELLQSRENFLKQKNTPLPKDIGELIERREKARLAKNWGESDKLRDLLREKGFEINDTDGGPEVEAINAKNFR